MPRRVLHDTFFKQAKAEGYVARSAYKLRQIHDARHLLRPGDRVLDLGCAPGAWMQVAAQIVGPSGAVVGIDLQPVTQRFTPPPPVAHIVGDISKTPAGVLLAELSKIAVAPGAQHTATPVLFDVVLSDMAPNTTGHGDHERSVVLCEHVLSMLPALLKKGGGCAMKVFEGGQYPRLLRDADRLFHQCKGFKPEASRSVSREMYVVCTGYKGG